MFLCSDFFAETILHPITFPADFDQVSVVQETVEDGGGCRNITDERYYEGSFDASIQVGRMNAYPAEPETYGVTFRKNFD